MKKLIASLITVGAVIAGAVKYTMTPSSPPTTLGVPLKIQQHAPGDSVAQYDTSAVITTSATPPNVAVSWSANPSTVVKVLVQGGSSGHSIRVVGLAQGKSRLTALWHISGYRYGQDTVTMTVTRPAVASMALFQGFANGVGIPIVNPGFISQGQQRCAYVVDYDRLGHVLTGRQFQLNFTDTTAQINGKGILSCPDTSVDPAKGNNLPNYAVPRKAKVTAGMIFVSDTNSMVDGHTAALITPHPAWTTLPGASWIWSEQQVLAPRSTVTKAFGRLLQVPGTVGAGTMQVAADNGVQVRFNGSVLYDHLLDTVPQYGAAVTFTVPGSLHHAGGLDTLLIVVQNFGSDTDDPTANPAGVLYRLTFSTSLKRPLRRKTRSRDGRRSTQ